MKFHKAPYDWADPCPSPPVQDDPGCPSTSSYTYFDTDWVKTMSDPQLSDPDPTRAYSHDVAYDYDVRGNQVSWKSPKGQTDRRTVTRIFFPSGMLKERKAKESGGGTRTYQYLYDKNHLMTRVTDVHPTDPQKNRTTQVTYDKAERPTLVNERWATGRDTAVAYDKDGLTTTRRTDGTVATAGDPSTYSGGKTTSFRYDAAGREDRMWVCTDDVDAECNAPGEPERETETTYHSGSNFIHTRTKPNDVVETFAFRDDSKISRMERDKGTNDLKGQNYSYDDNGNRTEDERGEHLFNARSQLIRWTKGRHSADEGGTVCYRLNGAGAITERTDSEPGDQTECDDGDLRTTFSYRGDRIDSATATHTNVGAPETEVDYDYDAFGSVELIAPNNGPDTTFDYDEFGRMIKSRGPGENTDRNYTFDGLDRRDTRTVGSDTYDFAYIGMTEKLSREEAPDGGGREVHSYDYDSGLRRQGKQTRAGAAMAPYRAYAKDANGSVEGLEDGEGEFLGTPDGQPNYRYDPYGELEDPDDDGDLEEHVGGDDARENPFRFEGFYYDSGIKTYDMQARPYRPDVGRFLTKDRYESAAGDLNLEADPITQNRYAFAGGNPVNRVEWDGHEPSKNPPPHVDKKGRCFGHCGNKRGGSAGSGGGSGGSGSGGSGGGHGTGPSTGNGGGPPPFEIAAPLMAVPKRSPSARAYTPRCGAPPLRKCDHPGDNGPNVRLDDPLLGAVEGYTRHQIPRLQSQRDLLRADLRRATSVLVADPFLTNEELARGHRNRATIDVRRNTGLQLHKMINVRNASRALGTGANTGIFIKDVADGKNVIESGLRGAGGGAGAAGGAVFGARTCAFGGVAGAGICGGIGAGFGGWVGDRAGGAAFRALDWAYQRVTPRCWGWCP